MGVYNKSILTTAGQALLASAVAGGGTVTFPQVQTSSYAYPAGTNIQALTSLQNVVQTAEPTDVAVFNDNLVQVSARYSNESITTDYLVQTIGVMAQLGTQSPVLFAVVQATTPDQMPAYNGSSPTALIYNIQTTVSGTDNISVTTNPAGTATVADVNNVLEKSSQIIAGEVPADPSSRQWFLSPASSPPAAGSTVLNVELKDAQGNIYYLQTSASQVYTASGQTVEQVLANKINTSAISNVQVNSTTNVPSSALAYSMQNAIDVLNANKQNKVAAPKGSNPDNVFDEGGWDSGDRGDGIVIYCFYNIIANFAIIQFRVSSGSLWVRTKWGANPWTNWHQIF